MIEGNKDAGGISGAGENGDINNCYNIGKVTANSNSGALLGYFYISISINNSYFLTGTANYALGGTTATNGSNPSGTKKLTSDELLNATNMLNAQQQPEVWMIDNNYVNDGYPILSWQK